MLVGGSGGGLSLSGTEEFSRNHSMKVFGSSNLRANILVMLIKNDTITHRAEKTRNALTTNMNNTTS